MECIQMGGKTHPQICAIQSKVNREVQLIFTRLFAVNVFLVFSYNIFFSLSM